MYQRVRATGSSFVATANRIRPAAVPVLVKPAGRQAFKARPLKAEKFVLVSPVSYGATNIPPSQLDELLFNTSDLRPSTRFVEESSEAPAIQFPIQPLSATNPYSANSASSNCTALSVYGGMIPLSVRSRTRTLAAPSGAQRHESTKACGLSVRSSVMSSESVPTGAEAASYQAISR